MKHRIIILGSIALALGLGGTASTLSFTSCNRINTADINAKVDEAAQAKPVETDEEEAGEETTKTPKATVAHEERTFATGDTVPASCLLTAADTASFFRIEPFVAPASSSDSKNAQQPLGIAPDSLRSVMCLHVNAEGHNMVGEIVVHRSIAETVLRILRQLHQAHYPIERMVPTDRYGYDDERSMAANNTSGYCPRRVAGSKSLSKHAMGLAVDINPLYNPCIRSQANGKQTIQPAAGKAYANRSKKFTYKLEPGDLCHKLFKQAGFTWGGDWRTVKDYQHFEKKN